MRWRTILFLFAIVLGALAATNPDDAALRQAMASELAQSATPRITRTNYAIFSVYRLEVEAKPPQCVLGAAGQFVPLRSC
jgi:hypothetical protein